MKNVKRLIKSHILTNKKEYIIMIIFLMVGIFLGILYINNVKEEQFNNISQYINTFIEKVKNTETIDNINLLKNSIISNMVLAFALWFFGTTVIGIPVVFGIMLYRGFCLGYTVSACISALGIMKGVTISIVNLLLQNIILIPAVLAMGVSGFKLYKSIVKSRNKDNIKLEMIRHTVFCLFMAVGLVISAFIETFISNFLVHMLVNKI